MLGVKEIILVIIILGGLFLLQSRTRAGSLVLYVIIGVLFLILIMATRIISSLLGVVILLTLVCAVLFWRLVRSR